MLPKYFSIQQRKLTCLFQFIKINIQFMKAITLKTQFFKYLHSAYKHYSKYNSSNFYNCINWGLILFINLITI